jgi:aspartate racemase
MAPFDPQIDRARDGQILGCTEVGMLLNGVNSPIPSFDETIIHVKARLLQS